MRLLHTADWHLGIRFRQRDLLADQAHVLSQLIKIAIDSKVQAVLIAGDVYDRGVPPAEAVELLDHTIEQLADQAGIPVFLIAGNHDDDVRVAFSSRLLAKSGYHVTGLLSADPGHVVMHDAHGPVHILSIPYVDPPKARECLADPNLTTHDAAFAAYLGRAKARIPPGERSVLIAHEFVAGGLACDSERPLTVGGTGAIDVARLDGFHYVALGHLHRPQASWGERIRYAGSLLQYSFSEIGQTKSVNIVDLDAQGNVQVESIPLVPRRPVRAIRGTLDELLRDVPGDASREDYLFVQLLDRGPVLEAMARLQERYPNALALEFPNRDVASTAGTAASIADQRRLSDAELFGGFFRYVTGEDLSEPEAQAFAELATDVRQKRDTGQ